MGKSSLKKSKDDISASIQRLQDQIVLAQHEGNTKQAKLIKLIIKRIELKSKQGW